jgi:hypothetical protein
VRIAQYLPLFIPFQFYKVKNTQGLDSNHHPPTFPFHFFLFNMFRLFFLLGLGLPQVEVPVSMCWVDMDQATEQFLPFRLDAHPGLPRLLTTVTATSTSAVYFSDRVVEALPTKYIHQRQHAPLTCLFLIQKALKRLSLRRQHLPLPLPQGVCACPSSPSSPSGGNVLHEAQEEAQVPPRTLVVGLREDGALHHL